MIETTYKHFITREANNQNPTGYRFIVLPTEALATGAANGDPLHYSPRPKSGVAVDTWLDRGKIIYQAFSSFVRVDRCDMMGAEHVVGEPELPQVTAWFEQQEILRAIPETEKNKSKGGRL
jgi:hypothetical protein